MWATVTLAYCGVNISLQKHSTSWNAAHSEKWNKSSNSDLKCIVHEHKDVITGCQVIELSLLSQTKPNLPDDLLSLSLSFFFSYCQNNYVGILTWQEEKQHMIWTVRGETTISLFRPGPYCSLPRTRFPKKVHQTTDLIAVPWHESHSRSPSAQSCFSPRTHHPPQSWLCTNSHSWHLNITNVWKKNTHKCPEGSTSVVSDYWPQKNISFVCVCKSFFFPLPGSHFNSALDPLRQDGGGGRKLY